MENSIKNIYEELNNTLNSFVRKLFSGLKKGGFCNHLRGFFFFINHLEKLV
jgi:hypothetical protein